jgi:diguanylate cyclase (GGDEF)-like protein
MYMSSSGGRNRTSPVSRWQLKPHHQIVVVAMIALVAFAIVGTVNALGLSKIDRVSSAGERDTEVGDALTRTIVLYRSVNAEVDEVFGADPGATRTAAILDLAAKSGLADQAWVAYKQSATGVSGETELRRTAELAAGRRSALVAPVSEGWTPVVGAADKAALNGATQIGALETLRSHYLNKQTADSRVTVTAIDKSRRGLAITTGAELFFLIAGSTITFVSVRRRYRYFHTLEAARAVEAARNELETRVARALEMVSNEEGAYTRVSRAIAEVAPDRRAQVLVADSSRAHLRQAVSLNLPSANSGCAVGTPQECPAITRGQTQMFGDSEALDACPYLAERADGQCSAACVPLSAGGKGIGVVHLIGTVGEAPAQETVTRLEVIAQKAGDRIGMLRAFSRSETEARTDQLTGLLNRRSLEDEVRRLSDSAQSYTVAYGDLDHFKELNDVYGHDAGDRALRLFSRVLRDSVRPRDIPARFGGEEFVVVLPDCSVSDATQVLERVRESLQRAQSAAAGPPFTVSFGLSDATADSTFDELLQSADRALARAKSQGRDRIIATSS